MLYFDDLKSFCFALREIATGVNGRPLSGKEAQTKAQFALTAAGYRWSGYTPEFASTEASPSPPQGKGRRRAPVLGA
jgi:hypothetical protein